MSGPHVETKNPCELFGDGMGAAKADRLIDYELANSSLAIAPFLVRGRHHPQTVFGTQGEILRQLWRLQGPHEDVVLKVRWCSVETVCFEVHLPREVQKYAFRTQNSIAQISLRTRFLQLFHWSTSCCENNVVNKHLCPACQGALQALVTWTVFQGNAP